MLFLRVRKFLLRSRERKLGSPQHGERCQSWSFFRENVLGSRIPGFVLCSFISLPGQLTGWPEIDQYLASSTTAAAAALNRKVD